MRRAEMQGFFLRDQILSLCESGQNGGKRARCLLQSAGPRTSSLKVSVVAKINVYAARRNPEGFRERDQPVCCAAPLCSLPTSLPGFTWTSVILYGLGGGLASGIAPEISLLPRFLTPRRALFNVSRARALRQPHGNQARRFARITYAR